MCNLFGKIGSIIVATILLAPYIYTLIYALSKIIWVKIFFKYDKDSIKRYKKSINS